VTENKSEKNDPTPKDKKVSPKNSPKEIGGRKGPDPVRYGDWENNGIASDF
jgi:hypothetical protein